MILNKNILSKKSSAHWGFRVNSVLARTGCISLFREIIMQPMGKHKIEIECVLTKLCSFKVSRGQPSMKKEAISNAYWIPPAG